MPSSITELGAASAYPWYGYAALVTAANTAKPKVKQTRFTAKPMHFGAICNQGTLCIADPAADRQMADFFAFDVGQDGGLRIVYDDTTNEWDGASLFYTRQISGDSVLGRGLDGRPAQTPVTDPTGDAQYPHFSAVGIGPNVPQLDLTRVSVTQPNASTLEFKLSVNDLSQLVPPAGKTTPLWLVRFQALGPLATQDGEVYPVFYVYMEKKAGAVPQFWAGTATCVDTTPNNCKLLQYPETRAVDGSIDGNTITIDAGIKTAFGTPIDGQTLYNVTAFTFGRNAASDDLYADVDASQPFDLQLK
jgi:hypothetical protein